MSWLLNLGYLFFLLLASPWLLWRRWVSGKNKRGWQQKLFGNVAVRNTKGPCIWLHAVSVGEVILLEPILQKLRAAKPNFKFAISTTTESGYDLALERYPNDDVFFCPFDFTWSVNRVLRRIRPVMLILAELELWPNTIKVVSEANIPIAVVNGRLSERSFRGYSRWGGIGGLVTTMMRRLSLVCVQDNEYAERFKALGSDPAKIFVTGSVKFDGVETDRENAKSRRLARIANIHPEEFVLVAGSTQAEEDLMAAECYRQLKMDHPKLRLILVPRHVERVPALISELKLRGFQTVLRSQLNDQKTCSHADAILIVDVIGELAGWWGVANAAYVGGSMGNRGGQNMIEPAAYGVPVSFGPNTENFQRVVDPLLAAKAAVVVESIHELADFFRRSLKSTEWSAEIGNRAKNVVLDYLGASERTVDLLCQQLATCSGCENEVDSSSKAA